MLVELYNHLANGRCVQTCVTVALLFLQCILQALEGTNNKIQMMQRRAYGFREQ